VIGQELFNMPTGRQFEQPALAIPRSPACLGQGTRAGTEDVA